MDGRIVAENDKVPPVFQYLEAAPFDLGNESRAADEPLDIADLAFDDTALSGLAGGQKLCQPALGGKMFRKLCHAPNLPERGKQPVNLASQCIGPRPGERP